ncbi:hypothetical protein DOTSEDRAFT_33909 [Dothistroma septosporum NZE10]|uniref:Uncharacterized protein n=1 Tax=Dothistroma septosporum (strain NZE10 / CBS 128990) TaxID=675120 RepID=N1PPT7_DOTSN|nr:hypothetical protein DOTSEDRAFT_33909 [Dothistroma septosporum NZE10]
MSAGLKNMGTSSSECAQLILALSRMKSPCDKGQVAMAEPTFTQGLVNGEYIQSPQLSHSSKAPQIPLPTYPSQPHQFKTMCRHSVFNLLRVGQKLKIAEVCHQAKTNYQGMLYCQNDPYAHVSDSNSSRDHTAETCGPGIRLNSNCRVAHGMASVGKLDFKAHDLAVDVQEFDISSAACAEREDRWYRQCLTTLQQLDAIGLQMPPRMEVMSAHAKWWLYIQHMPAQWVATWAELSTMDKPDEISRAELNPRHLSQRALHHVDGHHLPVNITDTRHSTRKVHVWTTPRIPALGPFEVRTHTCKPHVGNCKTCGNYRGKQYAKKPHKYQEADFDQLLSKVENDRPTDLSGLQIDMPHVRPTLSTPTPFHGNNYNRTIGLVNMGVLWPSSEASYAALNGRTSIATAEHALLPGADATYGLGRPRLHFGSPGGNDDAMMVDVRWMMRTGRSRTDQDVAMLMDRPRFLMVTLQDLSLLDTFDPALATALAAGFLTPDSTADLLSAAFLAVAMLYAHGDLSNVSVITFPQDVQLSCLSTWLALTSSAAIALVLRVAAALPQWQRMIPIAVDSVDNFHM